MTDKNFKNQLYLEVPNVAHKDILADYKKFIMICVVLGGLSFLAFIISFFLPEKFSIITTTLFGITSISCFILVKFLKIKRRAKEKSFNNTIDIKV